MEKSKAQLLSVPLTSLYLFPDAGDGAPPDVPLDLVARIQDELNIDPASQEAKPFLRLIIARLWEEEVATWRQWSRPVEEGQAPSPVTVRLETLARLGGVAGVLEAHLWTVMEGLTGREREMAAQIFYHLAAPSGTRVSFSSADLAQYTGLAVADLTPLLQKLCSADCQILRESTSSGRPRYKLFHPILAKSILNWRRDYLEQQEQTGTEQQRQQEATAQPQSLPRRIWPAGLARLRIAELVFLPPLLMALVIFAWQQRNNALHTRAAAPASRIEIAAYPFPARTAGMFDAYLLDHPQESFSSAASSNIIRIGGTDDAAHTFFAGSPGMLDYYLLNHPQESHSLSASSNITKVGGTDDAAHTLFAGSPGMLDYYLLSHPQE